MNSIWDYIIWGFRSEEEEEDEKEEKSLVVAAERNINSVIKTLREQNDTALDSLATLLARHYTTFVDYYEAHRNPLKAYEEDVGRAYDVIREHFETENDELYQLLRRMLVVIEQEHLKAIKFVMKAKKKRLFISSQQASATEKRARALLLDAERRRTLQLAKLIITSGTVSTFSLGLIKTNQALDLPFMFINNLLSNLNSLGMCYTDEVRIAEPTLANQLWGLFSTQTETLETVSVRRDQLFCNALFALSDGGIKLIGDLGQGKEGLLWIIMSISLMFLLAVVFKGDENVVVLKENAVEEEEEEEEREGEEEEG